MSYEKDYYDYEEEDKSHWDKPKPNFSQGAQDAPFSCPDCGSYNTIQATYAELCNSCGWGQGY